MKILWISFAVVLLMGAWLGSLAEGQVFLEQPADVVVYQEGSKTYARIVEEGITTLLNLNKGDVIATTEKGLSQVEVLQKALDIPHKACLENMEKIKEPGKRSAAIRTIKLLIKNGTYNLEKEGLRIPHSYPFVIQGEDKEKTILEYYGKQIAVGFSEEEIAKNSANNQCILEIKNLTIRIKDDAEAAIWSMKIENDLFENLNIIAEEGTSPKRGLWIVGGEGHLRFVNSVNVSGPFETAIDAPAWWFSMFNVGVRNFRKYGINAPGQKLIYARIYTDCKEAIAGIGRVGVGRGASGGGYRCMDRMSFFKTDYQQGEYSKDTSKGGCVCITDNSPYLPGYSPLVVKNRILALADFKARNYKKIANVEKGRLDILPEKLARLLPDFEKIANLTSYAEPEIDIIVFRDKDDQLKAQVTGKRLAQKMGVEPGFLIPPSSDYIQKCMDLIPQRGKIYFKQGVYEIGKLRIPHDSEITIEGHSCFNAYGRQGFGTILSGNIEFKDVGKQHRYFCLKNVKVQGQIELRRLKDAVVKHVNIIGFSQTALAINDCKSTILMNMRLQYGREGAVAIDDHGENTLIISPWIGPEIKLGKNCVAIGAAQCWGGIYCYPFADKVLIIAHQVEGIPPYTADGSKLYLLGCGRCRMTGPDTDYQGINNGEIVILKGSD